MTVKEYAESKGMDVKAVLARIRRTGKLDGVNIEKSNRGYLLTLGVSVNTEVVNKGVFVNKAVNYPKADGRFEERARGVVVDAMVRVSMDPSDPDKDIMVPETEWRARMDVKCLHGLYGWACTNCLNGIDKPVKPNRLADEWEKRITRDMGPLYLTDEYHTLDDGRKIQLRRRSKEPKENWVRV